METGPDNTLANGIALSHLIKVFEDTSNQLSSKEILNRQDEFIAAAKLVPKYPKSSYWLAVPINEELQHPDLILSFSQLTYVDLYLFQKDSLVLFRQAGSFQSKQFIHPDDARFYFNISLIPGATDVLLLKVNHTKGYQPNFDFKLQQKDRFIESLHKQQLIDRLFQGAAAAFFCYTLLTWLVSRFRPYLWLLLFIAGTNLYAISMGGYFVDWFFPNAPETGWLFNIHFLHLGLAGLYLLIIDFWEIKVKSKRLYTFGRLLVLGVAILAICSFIIDYTWGNYQLMNTLNVWSFVLPFSFIAITMYRCWRDLDRSQKFLAYGIIFFVIAGLVTTLMAGLLQERSHAITPYISQTTTLIVVLLFSIGLTEKLRLHEIEKNEALEKLTLIQQQQNILLEQKVAERTLDLTKSNIELSTQQALLQDKNKKIEVLINELNHRVKNNLQMLYSLFHLQAAHLKSAEAKAFVDDNIARIRAMILANDHLFRFDEDSPLYLNNFVNELASYVQGIYDPQKNVRININIPVQIVVDNKYTLPFGLILTELLTNSFKYAFHNQPAPLIEMSLTDQKATTVKFIYSDNGSGFNFDAGNRQDSMGMMLIKDLTRQIKGELDIKSENGLIYTFCFERPYDQDFNH